MPATNLIPAFKTFQRHLEFAIYIRLLRPGDLLLIHAELIAAFMLIHPPHTPRPIRQRSMREAFVRAFVIAG